MSISTLSTLIDDQTIYGKVHVRLRRMHVAGKDNYLVTYDFHDTEVTCANYYPSTNPALAKWDSHVLGYYGEDQFEVRLPPGDPVEDLIRGAVETRNPLPLLDYLLERDLSPIINWSLTYLIKNLAGTP